MFGLIGNLTKTALGVATTPIIAVKDTVEVVVDPFKDKKKSTDFYEDTEKSIDKTVESLSNVFDPDEW